MFRRLFVWLVLVWTFSEARANVSVYVDCNLSHVPVSGVNCAGLQPLLEEQLSEAATPHTQFLLTQDLQSADIRIKLSFSVEPQTRSIRYALLYYRRANRANNSALGDTWSIVHVGTIRLSMGAGVAASQHFLDIVSWIRFDVVALSGNFATPRFQSGAATLQLQEPTIGGSRRTRSPWAFAPSGSIHFSLADSTSVDASVGVNLLGSWPRHVLRVHSRGQYQFSSVQLPDGQVLTGEAVAVNGSVLYVLSLADLRGNSVWRRFGIDIGLHGRRAPTDNFDALAGGSIGVEWNLHPRIEEGSDPNFSLRYTVSAEYQRYLMRTARGRDADAVFTQSLMAAGRFHWAQLDITIYGQVATLLESSLYPEIEAGTQVEFRPIPPLSFVLGGSLNYQPNNAYHAWVTPPVSLGILGTQTGFPQVSGSGGLTVRFTWGNQDHSIREQRGR